MRSDSSRASSDRANLIAAEIERRQGRVAGQSGGQARGPPVSELVVLQIQCLQHRVASKRLHLPAPLLPRPGSRRPADPGPSDRPCLPPAAPDSPPDSSSPHHPRAFSFEQISGDFTLFLNDDMDWRHHKSCTKLYLRCTSAYSA